jgi:DNA polymerase (family 10)
MQNSEIAQKFEDIANLLEIKGESGYKVRAYQRAAEAIRNQGEDLEIVSREARLEEIPGVGKAIAEKIEEMLASGELGYYTQLTGEIPESLLGLLGVEGVGPKKAALFWKELGIENVEGLESSAREGKLRTLPGMGPRSEENILAAIARHKSQASGRMLISEADNVAEALLESIRGIKGVDRAELAGSLRRRRETIGDLDLVVATEDARGVLEDVVGLPIVRRVIGHGDTKASVELQGGVKAQIWAHPLARFGSALQYATGSQSHNVRLRELALKQGLSLSEHGFLGEGREILCGEEQEVYQAIGLEWIPPELREDGGELKAATGGRLPELIEPGDIKGELHAHSDWSDGRASIMEMVEGALERGLDYIAITDHSRSLGIANGLSIERLKDQRVEIEKIRKKMGKKVKILHGAEVEVLNDGTLDYPDDILEELDIVIASLHTSLRQGREQVTSRVLGAIRNPHVDIIGHLTGRLINRREPADLDVELLLNEASESGVILEINANPERLDLKDVHARRAVELGCWLAISTDAHHPEQLDYKRYGVGVARRGWIEAESILNTRAADEILDWLTRRSV